VGNEHNDPRVLAELLVKQGHTVWLDIWRLESGRTGGMFEQIAQGIKNAKVVVVFMSAEVGADSGVIFSQNHVTNIDVSEQYARSENCRMELQFATRSLRKPFLPVICGSGDTWQVFSWFV
jgi:hypothetical protein